MILYKKIIFESILIIFTTIGFSLISEGPFVWEEWSTSSIYNSIFTFFLVISSWWGLKKMHQNLDKTSMINGTNTILIAIVTTVLLCGYVNIANWVYIELFWHEKLINTHFFSMVLPLAVMTFISWNLFYLNRFAFTFPDTTIKNIRLDKEVSKSNIDKIIVSDGNRKIILQIEDIAFFSIENNITFAFLFNGQQYVIENSLSELEQKIASDNFFRINRQYIVSKDAIIDFNPLKNQKIKVRFCTLQNSDLNSEISRYKSAKFKKWIYS